MRRIARWTAVAALAAGLVGVPAVMAQRLNVQAGKWTIDYGEARCTLARRIGDAQSPVFILSSFLGRDNPEVMLVRDGSGALPQLPSRVDVVLVPTNVARTGVVRRRLLQGGTASIVEDLGEGFIEHFAEAQQVRIQSGGRVLATLDIPSAGMAVNALKECNDDLLRSWGIDTAARDAWQRGPRLTAGYITNNDYPDEAVRRRESGTVVVRLTVNADGSASDCVPVVRSGSALLDQATCRAATGRFRFDPALNAAGQPTRAIYVQTVRWILPDG